ncbi:MAG: DNA sulfur modification protein DndB, partial [Verrucomicrobiales bacterium]
LVILESSIFRDIVEMEKSSLAKRSRKLFTLSAFYNACSSLIQELATGDLEKDAKIARDYWEAVAKQFPAWIQVKEGHMPASEVRETFIHSHGIVLQALGRAGNELMKSKPDHWKKELPALQQIDWSRKNTRTWEGRAMHLGVVQKKNANITLTTNLIKQTLGLELNTEELETEEQHTQSR